LYAVQWSPDGTRLAYGTSGGGEVRVWDAAADRIALTLSDCGRPAFSPDGRLIAATAADGTVDVFDAATGEWVRAMQTPSAGGNNLSFSPDGTRLAGGGGSYQQPDATAEGQVWDVATGRELFRLGGHVGRLPWVAYSPDGRRLVSTGKDGKVILHDSDTGRPVRVLAGPNYCEAAAFSPDGSLLAAAFWGGATVVWDAATGAERVRLGGHTGGVSGVAFSPDGRRLYTAGMDATAREWDVTTGRPLTVFRGHTGRVCGVAVRGDGRLATASHDKTVRVWASRPAD
jgi:WD40 repeat protein